MTSDPNPPEDEPQPPRDMPLRKMWISGAFSAVAAITAVVMAPTNPEGWLFLVPLSGLVWITRRELRRRAMAQQSDARP